MTRRIVPLAALVLALGGAHPACAQYANQTGKVVGTIGGACNSTNNDYGWPDTNGNILKCVSNVWTLQGITAAAAGSTGYVQFNNGGVLAGSSNLFWNNSSGYLGIGTTAPQTLVDASAGEVRVGDSGTHCSSNTVGAIRYLTGSLQFCNGTSWHNLAVTGLAGGLVSFTSSGTFTVPTGVTSVAVLVVGGGGSGGGDIGGGGGAGGVTYNSSFTVTPGANLTVTVGAGGAATANNNVSGSNGGSSSFSTVTAAGGGAGGGYNTAAGSGGSGGGGGSAIGGAAGTAGQGYAGASGAGGTTYGGGGGGGGGVGSGGTGGTGYTSTITGSSVTYACGGGAGGYGGASYSGYPGGCSGAGTGNNAAVGTNGTANTGGGGGGGGNYGGAVYGGGAGGSGIVIVQYAEP